MSHGQTPSSGFVIRRLVATQYRPSGWLPGWRATQTEADHYLEHDVLPFLLPYANRPLGRVCVRFDSQTCHEAGVEVGSRVEATEEGLQASVELGIRVAHAFALTCRRQRSAWRVRDAATFSQFQRAWTTW